MKVEMLVLLLLLERGILVQKLRLVLLWLIQLIRLVGVCLLMLLEVWHVWLEQGLLLYWLLAEAATYLQRLERGGLELVQVTEVVLLVKDVVNGRGV